MILTQLGLLTLLVNGGVSVSASQHPRPQPRSTGKHLNPMNKQLSIKLLFLIASEPILAANSTTDRDTFVSALLANLTTAELAHQLHLTFADNVIGPKSQNELYEGLVGNRGVGVIHDW